VYSRLEAAVRGGTVVHDGGRRYYAVHKSLHAPLPERARTCAVVCESLGADTEFGAAAFVQY
jgi:hypothetical protein